MTTRLLWCPIILILLLVGYGVPGSSVRAQVVSPPTTTSGQPPQAGGSLPVDLSRIKSGLTRPVHINLDDGRVKFFASVSEPRGKTFKELSVNFDLRNGQVPGASMTHQEFLGMVTPRIRYTSGIGESMKLFAWSLGETVAWWGVRKLYKELSEARDERRRQEIQQQIDRELAALRGIKR